MMSAPLMHALLDAIVFLALSSDDVVDQDSAVRMLEWIAHTLSALSEAEKKEFFDFAKELGKRELEVGGSPQRVETLMNLDEALSV